MRVALALIALVWAACTNVVELREESDGGGIDARADAAGDASAELSCACRRACREPGECSDLGGVCDPGLQLCDDPEPPPCTTASGCDGRGERCVLVDEPAVACPE